MPAEFTRNSAGVPFVRLPDHDGWAPQVGFSGGFQVGRNPKSGQSWMAHCYGTVGAGRDTAADSSNGTELYVVDGQSPRQLDRNITVVGRVVQGMELLSVMPRGTGPLGVYEKAEQRVPIKSITLAADLPEAQRTPQTSARLSLHAAIIFTAALRSGVLTIRVLLHGSCCGTRFVHNAISVSA